MNSFPLDGGRLGWGWRARRSSPPHPGPPPQRGEGEDFSHLCVAMCRYGCPLREGRGAGDGSWRLALTLTLSQRERESVCGSGVAHSPCFLSESSEANNRMSAENAGSAEP